MQPELLDHLPATDRRAIYSRRDLRRINAWMGHAGTICRRLRDGFGRQTPRTIVELGAGDGTLLLKVARRLGPRWKPVRVVLVDRQGLVTPATRAAFAALSWPIDEAQMDVFEWLGRPDAELCDVTLANLFLHHFADSDLRRLLTRVAGQTRLFLTCEPRRDAIALSAARLLPLIGGNDVTCHDARASVRAGFAGRELSALWPSKGWRTSEGRAGPFTHCFHATRDAQ